MTAAVLLAAAQCMQGYTAAQSAVHTSDKDIKIRVKDFEGLTLSS